MKIAFPYLDAVNRRDKEGILQVLKSEVARGAVVVTPIMPTKIKSRLKTQMLKKKDPRSSEESEKLFSRVGAELVPRGSR